MESNKRCSDNAGECPPKKCSILNRIHIKDSKYDGEEKWINDGVMYFGVLRYVYPRENSVIFEFHDNGCIIDAWSSKHMKENMKELKINNEYYLNGSKGGMKLVELGRSRYNKASNSSLQFSVRLDKVVVAVSNENCPIVEETTNFEEIHESILCGKRFTKFIKNVTIRYGNFYRYLGCGICKAGIKQNLSQEYTCKTCGSKTTERSYCLMARDIMLKDVFGNTLQGIMASERTCQILLTNARLEELRESFLEDTARAEFEKFYNQKVNGYLKNVEGYNDESTANKLLIENIEILNNEQSNDSDLNDEDDVAISESTQSQSYTSRSGSLINSGLPEFENMQRENGYYRTTYSTSGKACGLAFVINIYHIDGLNERSGSEKDVESLRSTFEFLKIRLFKDKVFEPMNKREFAESLTEFKKVLVNHDYAISFVVIMSHGAGESNKILLGKREEEVHIWKDVIHHFGYSSFNEFYGKPKVFIFQGCQNEIEKDLKQESFNLAGDRMPDILFALPCPPGVKAKRNPKKGAYFIQAFMEELRENADKDHLRDILEKACKKLQSRALRGKEGDEFNTPVISTTSFDKFYFPNFLRKNFGQDYME